MLIREQGRLIKLLRAVPPKRPSIRARARECVIGTFRADEPVPTGLLDTLSRDERKLLERWLEAYRKSKARDQVRPVLASAPEQLERLVGALEVAADTLSSAEADQIWAQLHAIARTLKRAGRPRAARRPPAPLPGQQDFFGEFDELERLAEQ
ncbi:hypothetical protein [Burkholderia anthina]|uniref:hypothetical protein n=1 Tax=Burkholderia anthina TaxID=179879 RepID=UPI00292D13BF|nr:hypothetical protein [Burkholderia anthina]WJN72126.1 hypothetical protein OH687_39010 [Burkholderia anthina]